MKRIPRNTPAASPRRKAADNELTRLKMELVAARERGEARALPQMLASHPKYAGELAEFSAALLATSIDDPAAITPESEQIAARARSRAFASVFGTAVAPAPVAAVAPARAVSLKALRQARGLSMPEAARKLGLGLDVLSSLEAGRIAARTIPDRLVRALGEMLDAATEQMQALLQGQATVRPAFQRSRSGETKHGQTPQEMDFAEAVRLSVEMTPEQKAQWLEEE